MKQTILFGNGINRLCGSDYEWQCILDKVRENGTCHENVPNTYQYEEILIKNPRSLDTFQNHEDSLKSKVACVLQELPYKANNNVSEYYKKLFNIPADYYLTTNYDTTYHIGLSSNGFDVGSTHKSELVYSLRRRNWWKSDIQNRRICLWTIHGQYSKSNTMMLGLDHYCGSIARISNYFERGISFSNHNTDYEDYTKRKRSLSKQTDYYPYIFYRIEHAPTKEELKYWVDTFFFTDVHIIGFGFSFDEIDLWWLLNKRKRLMAQNCKVRNKIYFYGYVDNDIANMLKAFDVIIENCPFVKPQVGDEWKELYHSSLDLMEKNVLKGKIR